MRAFPISKTPAKRRTSPRPLLQSEGALPPRRRHAQTLHIAERPTEVARLRLRSWIDRTVRGVHRVADVVVLVAAVPGVLDVVHLTGGDRRAPLDAVPQAALLGAHGVEEGLVAELGD